MRPARIGTATRPARNETDRVQNIVHRKIEKNTLLFVERSQFCREDYLLAATNISST
jgi:hypothetical protein